MQYIIKILKTEFITHDTKLFITTKPKNYKFKPGQATELAINLPDYKNKKRPFTFTSLNKNNYLEFIIKTYPKYDGVTKKLLDLKPGDEFIIEKPWGTIQYKGLGTFIAGGAGITPFISILRKLQKENQLEKTHCSFQTK